MNKENKNYNNLHISNSTDGNIEAGNVINNNTIVDKIKSDSENALGNNITIYPQFILNHPEISTTTLINTNNNLFVNDCTTDNIGITTGKGLSIYKNNKYRRFSKELKNSQYKITTDKATMYPFLSKGIKNCGLMPLYMQGTPDLQTITLNCNYYKSKYSGQNVYSTYAYHRGVKYCENKFSCTRCQIYYRYQEYLKLRETIRISHEQGYSVYFITLTFKHDKDFYNNHSLSDAIGKNPKTVTSKNKKQGLNGAFNVFMNNLKKNLSSIDDFYFKILEIDINLSTGNKVKNGLNTQYTDEKISNPTLVNSKNKVKTNDISTSGVNIATDDFTSQKSNPNNVKINNNNMTSNKYEIINWHPHIHMLLFIKDSKMELKQLSDKLQDYWNKGLKSVKLPKSKNGISCNMKQVESSDDARDRIARYMTCSYDIEQEIVSSIAPETTKVKNNYLSARLLELIWVDTFVFKEKYKLKWLTNLSAPEIKTIYGEYLKNMEGQRLCSGTQEKKLPIQIQTARKNATKKNDDKEKYNVQVEINSSELQSYENKILEAIKTVYYNITPPAPSADNQINKNECSFIQGIPDANLLKILKKINFMSSYTFSEDVDTIRFNKEMNQVRNELQVFINRLNKHFNLKISITTSETDKISRNFTRLNPDFVTSFSYTKPLSVLLGEYKLHDTLTQVFKKEKHLSHVAYFFELMLQDRVKWIKDDIPDNYFESSDTSYNKTLFNFVYKHERPQGQN